MQTEGFSIDNVPKRVAAAFLILFVLAFSAFAIIWGFGNAAASQAEFVEVADQAVSLSPNDPQTQYATAVLLDKSFEAGDFERALKHYEHAAELAPNDYWLWLELGRAYERRGEAERGIAAMRYAFKLAPNYSVVQWTLGNAILRTGNSVEAFELIRKAVAGDPKYTEPAANLAWQMNSGDLSAVRAAVGDSVRLTAALAGILAREKKFDEAAAVWDGIPAEDRQRTLSEAGKALLNGMIDARRYQAAVKIAADVVKSGEDRFAEGQIFNGGFESPVRPSGASIFDWQLGNGQNPQIVLTNGQKHSGNNSLVLVFNAADRAGDIRGFTQTVAVKPGGSYILRIHYRAEMTATATFQWSVTNASDGSPIAASEPLKPRTDWAVSEIRFTVPSNTDGVFVSFSRGACAAGSCAAAGNMWFDDISLTEQ